MTDTIHLPDRRLAIDLLSDAVVADHAWYADCVRRLGERLVVRLSGWRRDLSHQNCHQSLDGGLNWSPCEADPGLAASAMASARADGSIVGWSGAWNLATAYDGTPGQPIPHRFFSAASWEALAAGTCREQPATIDLPYMVPLTGDDDSVRYTPALWGKLVESAHGHLIQAAYPVLAQDLGVPRLWPEHRRIGPQYRCCVIYSRDEGASWHYLATVAAPRDYPLPAQAEGYCEPDLLVFPDGHLLCVMRTGGGAVAKRHYERLMPLVAARSADHGLTWSPPVPIAPHGVKPVLLRLNSGLTLCLAGRPGFFLLLSADDGRTWSTPHWLDDSHGPWGQCPSGYGALIELEPDVIGIAYDTYDATHGHQLTRFRRCRLYPT